MSHRTPGGLGASASPQQQPAWLLSHLSIGIPSAWVARKGYLRGPNLCPFGFRLFCLQRKVVTCAGLSLVLDLAVLQRQKTGFDWNLGLQQSFESCLAARQKVTILSGRFWPCVLAGQGY